jgi:hypothetical protein
MNAHESFFQFLPRPIAQFDLCTLRQRLADGDEMKRSILKITDRVVKSVASGATKN